jgi:sec-independent protein translocase protein TatB
MFNFSCGELLLVAIVALIVLGPKQLQTCALHCGKFIKYLRNLWRAMQAELKQ